jgi:ABC-2 type transport system permease protein
MAPLTNLQILSGKALSCFVSILFVELMLLGVAIGFGVRPTSYAMLALGGLSAAICFVGFMMLVASLGKTEQTASGAAWAMLMPLAMIGGAMVPTFVMPAWIQSISFISPIRWTMLAIEGGVWRQFTITEMAMPCAILISVGIACFALGTRGLKEA